MLEIGRNGMIAFFEQAKNNKIEGIGGIVGKAEAVWIIPIKELRQQLPGLFYKMASLNTAIIARAARINPVMTIKIIHKGIHFLRLGKSRCAIIEINYIFHDCFQA